MTTTFRSKTKMNITLYKAHELARIENFVDQETGEIDVEALHAAEIVVADKQRAVTAFIKNESAALSLYDNAIAELLGKKQAHENRVKRLKAYLQDSMKVSGVTEISATDKTFSAKLYLDRDESVEIDDGAVFPPELMNAPKPPEPSKTKIKAAIKAGEAINGARIVRRDRLEIK